jgi:hypothetical protein
MHRSFGSLKTMHMIHVFLLISSTFSNVTVGTMYQIENSSYIHCTINQTCNAKWSPYNKLWWHEIFWVWGPLYTRSQGQCPTQNQAYLLVQKLKSSPKGFTLGVKAEIDQNIFNLPQVTNKCWILWLCIGPKAWKRISSNLRSQFANLGGQCSSI